MAKVDKKNEPKASGAAKDGNTTMSAGTGVLAQVAHAAEKAPTIFVVMFLAAAGILGVILWVVLFPQGTILDKLDQPAYARGVITFLIAIGSIGIAVLLTMSALTRTASGNSEVTEAKERFNRGKEVLTVLVGILGTVIGFYFGDLDSAQTPPQGDGTQKTAELQISPPRIEEANPAGGTEVTLRAFIAGGEAPYAYSLEFDPQLDGSWADLKTDDGWVLQKVPLPSFSKTQGLSVTISVKDKGDRQASRKVEIPIRAG